MTEKPEKLGIKMDLNQERSTDWKPSPNICRCCLTDGCYKDISVAYYYSAENEVYDEMLKETFDIHIPQLNCVGRLICENCIARLRDARAFKQIVLQSEATLSQYCDTVQQNEDTSMETGLKWPDVKVEPLSMEPDCASDGCHDGNSADDNEVLANIKQELTKTEDSLEDKGTGRRPARLKRSKKKSRTKHEEDTDQDKWSKLIERRGPGPLLRDTSLKLLANSTMCVFQWNKSWYRCFCCKQPFQHMNDLKQHTNSEHTLENIKQKIILQQNRLVKVEISDLSCKICDKTIENIEKLRLHLEEHGIKFDLNEDLLVPFKIEANLKCQICLEDFSVFRLLNIHMNKHFQKQVCHICGAAFSNLVFLNLHKTRSHRPFRCKQCNEIFSNKMDKKHHEMSVHNIKYERKLRFPCPYCSERFFQENFKVLHLVEKHGFPKPQHKCLVCEKSFVTRSLCNNHMKNVHMKEKNHECDVCHNLFYTKSDVARHRVTHTGEKRFSCSLCSSPFATKDSLRRHVKRTHVGLH